VSISRLAKRRGVSIAYRTLTNGFAVLLNKSANKPKSAPTRRRRARQPNSSETTSR